MRRNWVRRSRGVFGFATAAALIAVVAAAPSDKAPAAPPQIPSDVRRLPRSSDTVFATSAGTALQLTVNFQPHDSVEQLLVRIGTSKSDAAQVAKLVEDALPAGVPDSTNITLGLGEKAGESGRRFEWMSFSPGPASRIIVGRTLSNSLRLAREEIAVDATPQRFKGRADHDLFWALRAAGVPAQSARDYIQALSPRIDLRTIDANDRFDLVIDRLRTTDGAVKTGQLLYVGLDRAGNRGVRLVRWTLGGQSGWLDPSNGRQIGSEALGQPVSGAITSRFGYRVHPILRLARFHEGVDFGARWGTPVFAAAEGVVEGAGWRGGYGRQVRLAHEHGLSTSYSHLSEMLVSPGSRVAKGQIVGLVGSSGFSTGPHLHFEVLKNGHPVDPLSYRQTVSESLSRDELSTLRARLEQLRSI